MTPNSSDNRSSQASQTTRREFLRTSAVGAAALGTLPLQKAVHAAGTQTVRIGLIGCGGRGSGAAAQSMKAAPYVKLVAMYDVFADQIKTSLGHLKKMYPEQVMVDDDHCFTEFDGYKHVIDSVDVVLIACASKFHPMYAEAAIRAGKHVFVEKPHGIDPVGVRRMQAACDLAKKKGLSIVSGLHSRFHNGWKETVRRIHEGAIGDVVAVQSMFMRGPYRVIERDPKLTETQYQFRNWYHFRWLSGDDVTQSLVHNVDRISWVLKEEMPLRCFGLGGRASSFGEVYGDMFDHHTAVYEYESGPRMYAMCRTQNSCHHDGGDIIMGTKGTCRLNHCRIEGETNWRYQGKHNNPYAAEQKALIDAVVSGKPLNCGDYMAQSTMVAILGQLACYSGKRLSFKDTLAANLEFGPAPEQSTFATEPPSIKDKTGNYPLLRPGISKVM